ncbi:MAG: hypothetical protein RIR51_133 [Bacteroidota bacterium]
MIYKGEAVLNTCHKLKNITTKISIIGLGYVGLPLAVEFGKFFETIGFDINQLRIDELKNGVDRTLEINPSDLISSDNLIFTSRIEDIRDSNIYIITVPTPIDKFKAPDLKPLLSATEMISKVLKKDDIVIYESTVYPGCTEEDCVPVLEKFSGLKFNQDFFCGYSPERINPGDKNNTLTNIVKVTSGSNSTTAERVDQLYKTIIKAGTHKAPSLKVAEASKAIENAQRDLNISFMNELAIIFEKMGVDTNDVLDAAGTKWNFLKFKPGLVGGHCIGVDPYYLAHKAESLGYHPQVILSGRRINDGMGKFIAEKAVKLLISKSIPIKNSNALILGITFKENCPDIRNSKVIDVFNELKDYGMSLDVYDPWVEKEELIKEMGIKLIDSIEKKYELVILAVSHNQFLSLDFNLILNSNNSVLLDIKSVFPKGFSNYRL